MILEMALSILLNPEDMGFYVGPYSLEASHEEDMNANVFIVKLWFLMIQFTIFTLPKND